MTQFITFGEIADIATSDDEGSRVLDGIVFRKMTEIEGDAWITGEHTFIVDDRDPLRYGFVI